MKRLMPLLALVLTLTLVAVPLMWAAGAPAKPATSEKGSPALPIAAAVSTVTGIAISPLLGTGAYGAYQWLTAKDAAARDALPWYAQIKFWLPALLLVGVCAAKDSLGTVLPPGAKKPLDVLETIENKVSGLVAAGAVIPLTMGTLSKVLVSKAAVTGASGGLAMISLGSFDVSWLLNVLTVPFGVALFAIVWMASHAINVLILLSPWGAIDAALKGARTALLGVLVAASAINPWMGALLSAIVIVVAYFVAGWAFRLTIFGSVFCWDFLTLRRTRFTPAGNDNRMFSGADFAGSPIRTYGRLVKRPQGGLEFVYRPWLVLPERVAPVTAAPATLGAARGFLFSDIVNAEDRTFFSLPPRYRGHEEALARIYAMHGGVRDAGLRKAWGAVRTMLGGRVAHPASA